jgi:D-alanyl-lipoteichoic acid acyltransferase DltB (MBOAT superfamily)
MLFNSIEYLLFLPLVFAIYWSLNKHLKWQNGFLLLASYIFYGLWDYRFLSLIVISSLTDYLVGLSIASAKSRKSKILLLCISLCLNLGLLFIFKYFNFFIEGFVDFVGLWGYYPSITSLNIILPVGISFYTFQTLSYTIDIYRGKLKPTNSIVDFFTYVAFFPQLVAGPIERAAHLLPQIESKRKFDYQGSINGLRQILWGLFKKVVVADNCSIYVDSIFENYAELGALTLILGALLFAFQIYCDFSGYSDIAIGTARLLGINLMQNFATPYFARDIAEFWRRWHISLTTWFRDYVYIPLGGSRVGQYLQLRNVFVIFLVSGFWHGANWTFICWGFIHALSYIPQVFGRTNRKFLNTVASDTYLPNLTEFYQMIRTFSIVTLAWIFFRSPTLEVSINYIKRIFSVQTDVIEIFKGELKLENLWLTSIYIVVMLLVEWSNRDRIHGLERLPKHDVLRYFIYLILCLLILQYFYGETNFIYFQF